MVRPQMAQQTRTGIFDQIDHLVETALPTVVGVRDVGCLAILAVFDKKADFGVSGPGEIETPDVG